MLDVRQQLKEGARMRLDPLKDGELSAINTLVTEGKAVIVNEACKLFIIRVLAS